MEKTKKTAKREFSFYDYIDEMKKILEIATNENAEQADEQIFDVDDNITKKHQIINALEAIVNFYKELNSKYNDIKDDYDSLMKEYVSLLASFKHEKEVKFLAPDAELKPGNIIAVTNVNAHQFSKLMPLNSNDAQYIEIGRQLKEKNISLLEIRDKYGIK